MSAQAVAPHVVVLWAWAERTFMAAFWWRAFMFTLVAQHVVPPLLGLAVWQRALPELPAVATYFVVMLFVRMLTVSYEPQTFLEEIYGGGFTDRLLVPRPVVLEPLGKNLAWRAWHVLVALPLIAAVGLLTSVRVPWEHAALALPAVALAGLLRFLFSYALVLAAFWTQRAQAIAFAGGQLAFLLGGEAAPIPLVPEAQRVWLAVLPFRAMNGFPAEIAAGMVTDQEVAAGYALQALWLGTFAAAAALVWRAGVRRYTAVGG